MVGIPDKKPSQTPHCNSLNSSFLSVKLRLTSTDKRCVGATSMTLPSLLLLPSIQIPWTVARFNAVLAYANTTCNLKSSGECFWVLKKGEIKQLTSSGTLWLRIKSLSARGVNDKEMDVRDGTGDLEEMLPFHCYKQTFTHWGAQWLSSLELIMQSLHFSLSLSCSKQSRRFINVSASDIMVKLMTCRA